MSRWSDLTGNVSGAAYAERFARLAAAGHDMHGEAHFCSTLLESSDPLVPPRPVLDAGCGTGRVAIRLSELGYDCVGVDLDPSMLAVARASAPALDWRAGDLSQLRFLPGSFGLIVSAGNVIPLLAESSLAATLANLTNALAPAGHLVTGFGLDADHLPTRCPALSLTEFDAACAAVGLALVQRYSTWQRHPFDDGGYVVNVHRHAADR
ncbi:MAG: SAM-dependent methyltransferase [Frankiales bacterium]|nr:SAM-dependent methyltransferase [Frankiales bacterium]